MTRTRHVIGNWKMNTTRTEAVELAYRIGTVAPRSAIVGVAPPFPWLAPVADVLRGGNVRLGAQTCSAHAHGAYTGDVSAGMLAEVCSFVLVGHSERRTIFNESDDIVRAKLRAAIGAGLNAVLCVGESLDEREAGEHETVVTRQLRAALDGVPGDVGDRITIAYEPVWAIGTGRNATPDDASSMAAFISTASGELGLPSPLVLYGGSVNATNAESLIVGPEIGGFLVGGASLKADDFLAIVAAADV
jgi:triosephosphate isomerase (TIM)